LGTAERWRGRIAVAVALVVLILAHFVVNWIPFVRWKGSIGWHSETKPSAAAVRDALRIGARIERAALRLLLPTKCLPRAVAASWILRSKRIPHVLVFAARPKELRDRPDALHAWVEVGGITIIGELPGPWIETLRLAGEVDDETSDAHAD
jgi:hypothetical protein